MTTTTRNEAAERLSRWAPDPVVSPPEYLEWLQTKREALAAERRATVERIRAAINERAMAQDFDAKEAAAGAQVLETVAAILDEEAAR